jgi:adenylate cyclase
VQKQINRLLAVLFGDSRTFVLEHRLFNTLSLLNALANLGGTLRFLDFHSQKSLFFLHLGTGLLFLLFYLWSRFRGTFRAFYWAFILVVQLFLFVNTLINAGSLGGAHYYFIPALVIAIILSTRGRTTALAFTFCAAVPLALFWVEENRPDLVTPHLSDQARLVDVATNFLFAQLFTGLLVLVLARNLNQERKKSDRLLLNVLPSSVAEELKVKNKVEPRHYESVTVLFTDFVGFTAIAERLSPQELVNELDRCFREFDRIAKRHSLEKIKTIGDAYMAAGGIPQANESHAVDCVRAALEIQQFMETVKVKRQRENLPFWQLRIGIHTGPLVAGVIGEEKFAYDVWGDTVNTASRLESSGAASKINISGATYDQVKDYFDCDYRGLIPAKHKGEIEMYFVCSVRAGQLDF